MPDNSPDSQHPEIDPNINPDELIEEQPADNSIPNAIVVIAFILTIRQYAILRQYYVVLSTHIACLSLSAQAGTIAATTLINSGTLPISLARSGILPTFFSRRRTEILNDVNWPLARSESTASVVIVPKSNAEKLEEIPNFSMESVLEKYICPISLSIMTDPVYILGDNKTTQRFERRFIAQWLREHGTHPTTRDPFSEDALRSDDILRNKINTFVQIAECSHHGLKKTM